MELTGSIEIKQFWQIDYFSHSGWPRTTGQE